MESLGRPDANDSVRNRSEFNGVCLRLRHWFVAHHKDGWIEEFSSRVARDFQMEKVTMNPKRFLAAVAVAAVVCLGFAGAAQAQVTLPDIGVDVAGTSTAIGTAIGTIIAGTIALFGALYVVRLGIKWIRGMVR